MTLEYDGTRYRGWQRQRHHDQEETVQGTVEAALRRILRRPVSVQGASRTDAGVHALGQVAHFEAGEPPGVRALLRGLNAVLPGDVVVRSLDETSPGFHARHGATSKWYRYTVRNTPFPGALDRARVHWERRLLDVERMQRAARALVGTHDFRCFQKWAEREPRRSTVRSMHQVEVQRRGAYVSMDVVGDGFLYTMVRAMAGTLLDVGLARRRPQEMADVIASRSRARAGANLPARGLCLMQVSYGNAPIALRRDGSDTTT